MSIVTWPAHTVNTSTIAPDTANETYVCHRGLHGDLGVPGNIYRTILLEREQTTVKFD